MSSSFMMLRETKCIWLVDCVCPLNVLYGRTEQLMRHKTLPSKTFKAVKMKP